MLHARVAPTPKDTIWRDGKASLYRFRRGHGAVSGSEAARAVTTHVPVLLVPSMINRWYVMDLREGASVAAALSGGPDGATPWSTYLLDWGIPEDEDRYVTWDDTVARLDRVVRFIQRKTGAPSVAI